MALCSSYVANGGSHFTAILHISYIWYTIMVVCDSITVLHDEQKKSARHVYTRSPRSK